MARWEKRSLRLNRDHEWKSRPGFKIFVADRGAVRFDFPEDWVVSPGPDSIKFHDKTPPDDNCCLQLSVFHLPPGDWSGLPVADLVRQVHDKDREGLIARTDVVEILRHDLDIAWMETRYRDATENRIARERIAIARGSNIQPLLTIAFWDDDGSWVVPAWNEVLRSLRLGEYINDPRRGDLL